MAQENRLPKSQRLRKSKHLGLALLAIVALLWGGRHPEGRAAHRDTRSSAPYIKHSSSAIAITADGGTLLAVNPDSASLSIVDLTTSAVIEIAVGQDPRTVAVDDAGRRAYVTNRGSNSVTVVDLGARQAIADVPTAARPYGVVVNPHSKHLYVAEQGADQVTAFDATTFQPVISYPTLDRPSGLALSPDGDTLYVTHLYANKLTVIPLQPHTLYLPLVLNGELGNWEMGRLGSRDQFPNLSRSRLAPARLSNPAENGGFGNPPRAFRELLNLPIYQPTTIPLWPNSNLLQSIVIAPDGHTAYVPHTRANSGNHALTLDSTVFPGVSLVDLNTQQHLVGQQFDLAPLDPPAVGLPFDAALTPDGAELWVLNAASNDVTVIDLATRERAAHVEVGDNPRGIVVAPDGATAYVNNTLVGTVSVIDTSAYTVTAVLTVTNIPLSPTLLLGKRLFHSSDDPRMGRDQWMSCNTCHFDGEHDGQTWFLGFAGPRNTASLLGMRDTLPLRWSGEWDEAADAEFAIRMDSFGTGLVVGEMRCTISPPDCANQPPHSGLSPDLDALAAYLNALVVPLNSGHIRGEPLSEAAQRGQILFNDPTVGCATCHIPPLYTDGLSHDVGTATADERIGPAFNTPVLLGLYDSAPYFHDGSAPTLSHALTRPSAGSEHDLRGMLTEVEIEDLIAFLRALPFAGQNH